MDAYPSAYVAPSRPLIVLSGWSRSKTTEVKVIPQLGKGPRIHSDLPPINSARGQQLQDAFLSFNLDPGHAKPDRPPQHQSLSRLFRLRSCGRQYIFPCRKASPSASEVGSLVAPSATLLHSPLSPLSRGSPVYVDGIMTPLWPLKYHEAVPSVFLLFFSIAFDPQNDVLRDNHLKTEINAIKNSLAESNYRTKVAVVLIAEDSMRRAPDVDDRLGNIRKATKLDSKSTFFYLPPDAQTPNLTLFAESVLSALRPSCLEFYKAQYKHSRRKKDKKGESAPSSPSIEGLSQNLSKSGWNIRYEYKMAILSEFRSEMETAARHYKEVVDLLLGPAGLFNLYSSWSPRWNELRLLADSCALRRIRCLLACGLPSAAAKFWKTYRDMTKALLNRKGKGSSTYGWQAWESRLTSCMAESIDAAFTQITDSNARKIIDVLSRKQKYPYAPAEKTTQSDGLAPWNFLHHPGYWLYCSARHSETRNTLAMAIPEEDLVPPGQSPATRVAHRNEFYDTYLCPEPHFEGTVFNHKQEILNSLESATTEFFARDQIWMADRLKFAIAEKIAQGSNPDASLLQNLWRNHRWRNSGWGSLTRKIAHDLWLLSVQANDFQTQILTTWELLDSRWDKNNGAVYDLEGLCSRISKSISDDVDTRIDIRIQGEEISSFLNLDFIFEKESENLGEMLRAQALIYSTAHSGSAPIQLSEIFISLEGETSNIRIRSASEGQMESTQSSVHEVELREASNDSNALVGETSLKMSPHQTRVLALNLPLRESGKISAIKATAIIEKPSLRIEYSKTLSGGGGDVRWHVMREKGLSRQRRFRWTSCREVNVLPKLPKLKMRLPNVADKYYVDERAVIEIELTNEESWEVKGSLEVRIPGDHPGVSQPTLLPNSVDKTDNAAAGRSGQMCLIEAFASGGVEHRAVAIQMPSQPSDDMSFEIEAKYNGARESDNTVSKTTSAKLVVVEPIMATFFVSSNFHPDPWPSFFAAPDLPSSDAPTSLASGGLSSRWNLQVNISCLADDDLTIEKAELSLVDLSKGSKSSVMPANYSPTTLARGEDHEVNFTIDVAKATLEETAPPTFDPTLTVHWRRTNSTDTTCFAKVLAAPRLTLPTNEPRVVATRASSEEETVLIDIHLENPSMHYLTFELGIEASDDFAFSGPKLAILHLVPMSRHSVRFVLMPLVRGAFIQAKFKAVDVYFNKSLRVNAGTGLRRDADGSLLIWIDSDN